MGVTAGGTLRCPAPGWVSLSGDCRDDLPNAFPGQTAYFDEPFGEPNKPDGKSFDFDCDGSETPDPSNSFPDPAPECALLTCGGSGYLPVVPERTGGGSEARCGSNQLRTCTPATLSCTEGLLVLAEKFRCR